MTKHRSLRRGLVALGLATSLAIGGAFAAVSTNDEASAIGIVHKLIMPVANGSASFQKLARMTFTCNDATGAYTLKVTNVQVIKQDKTTAWDRRDVYAVLSGPTGNWFTTYKTLTQNTTNGLFNVSWSGTIPAADRAQCALGAVLFVYSGEAETGLPGAPTDLYLHSPLT